MQPLFCIFAPPFDANMGGRVVLHKLCDHINRLGGNGCLVPLFDSQNITLLNWPKVIKETIRQVYEYEAIMRNPDAFYARNPQYNTPLYQGAISDIATREDVVVVYPEIVPGNPLGAGNVARWLLHSPGFHTGVISAVKGEVQFRYSELFEPLGSVYVEVAPFLLNIVEIPWALYENRNPDVTRSGTAFAVRKGRGKELQHQAADAICIDGRSHEEVSQIFKRVEMFVSYDTETFYSALAVIAGATSVIIPDTSREGKDVNVNDPRRTQDGIAYGFDDIPRAIATAPELIRKCRQIDANSAGNVKLFMDFWEDRLCDRKGSAGKAKSFP